MIAMTTTAMTGPELDGKKAVPFILMSGTLSGDEVHR